GHSTDGNRRRVDEVDQVQRMAGIVVQGTAALVLGRAPGAALGPQDDRTVSLGTNVMHLPERTRLNDAGRLLESADKAVVVSDLIDEPFRFGHGCEALAV